MSQSMEEQIINRRLEEVKQVQPNGILTQEDLDVYKALAADFPEEAMTADKSRGFALTSIKAQYVTERLNEVLGVMNWTHGGEFQRVEEGVLYLGTLIITVNGRQNRQFAPGFARLSEGKNLGDVYKSAKTDSLSKAASLMGVGNSVFKGLVNPNNLGKSTTTKPVNNESSSSESQTAKPAVASFKTRRASKIESDF